MSTFASLSPLNISETLEIEAWFQGTTNQSINQSIKQF